MRGRPRKYNDPINISLKCDRFYHNVMEYLDVADSDVYLQGVFRIMHERALELTEEHFERLIQDLRVELKQQQEHIAFLERVKMDIGILKDTKTRQKTSVLKLRTGEEIMVVDAE